MKRILISKNYINNDTKWFFDKLLTKDFFTVKIFHFYIRKHKITFLVYITWYCGLNMDMDWRKLHWSFSKSNLIVIIVYDVESSHIRVTHLREDSRSRSKRHMVQKHLLKDLTFGLKIEPKLENWFLKLEGVISLSEGCWGFVGKHHSMFSCLEPWPCCMLLGSKILLSTNMLSQFGCVFGLGPQCVLTLTYVGVDWLAFHVFQLQLVRIT